MSQTIAGPGLPAAQQYPSQDQNQSPTLQQPQPPPSLVQEMMDQVDQRLEWPQTQSLEKWSGHVLPLWKSAQWTQCSVTTSQGDVEIISELKPELWPKKMIVDSYSKTTVDSETTLINLAKSQLLFVTVNFVEDARSLAHLNLVMEDEGKTRVGIVTPFDAVPSCPLKALFLFWNDKQSLFIGVIPLQQEKFVAAIKKMLDKMHKRQQQPWFKVAAATTMQQLLQQQQQRQQEERILTYLETASEEKQQQLFARMPADPEQQRQLLARAQTRRLQREQQQHQQQEEVRNTQARALFDKALEKGYILCHIDKCIMMGNAGAGKTHVMYRLFDKDPPAIRSSTPLAEAPIRAISRIVIGAVKRRSVDWFQVSGEEVMEMLAQAVQAGVPMEGEEGEQHPVTEEGRPSSSFQAPAASPNGSARQPTEDVATVNEESKPAKEIPIEESSQPVPQSLNFESSRALIPSAELVSPSSEEIIEMMEILPESKRLLEILWVHFIDTGGQPNFHELFASFIKNATAAVYVVKLNERLDHNPMIEYYQSGQPCGSASPSALSTDQILQHCVQTVHSQMVPSGVEPTFIVVGTHRDLEHTCTETRAEKNEKLLQILRPIVREGLMFFGQSLKEVIFPINAKDPEDEDREIAALIRKLISDKGSVLPPFKIPVGWFLLERDIRKLGRGVVSKAECREIAARLKINDESLEAALAYLHKLNVSLYYPDFLPEVVFCESQVLFDKITELVAFGFQLRCQSASRDAFEGSWLCFRDEGIVTRQLLKLERFSKHYVPGLFTPDNLLYLLECLLIVAPTNYGCTDYFMPSLLPSISKDDVGKHRLSTTSIVAPLLVHFSDGCAPNGLFCALVVYLISSCGWKIAYRSSSPSCIATPSCVARNCVEFQLQVPGSAILVNSYTHFEVHPSIPERLYPSFCRKTCQDILSGLEKVSKLRNCDSPRSTLAFFCCRCRGPAHPAVVHSSDDGQKFAKCTEDTRVFFELERRHTVWLEDTSTLAVGITCHESVDALLKSEAEPAGVYERVALNRDKIVRFLSADVSAGELADKLLVAGLISEHVREKALVTGLPVSETVRPMIDAVINRIELIVANYDKFISVLRQFGSLEDLIQFIEGSA